jgi:hypothetical protein
LELFHKERFTGISDCLNKVYDGFSQDELLLSLRDFNNQQTTEMAFQRMKQIIESSLGAEREMTIERLTKELIVLKEKN